MVYLKVRTVIFSWAVAARSRTSTRVVCIPAQPGKGNSDGEKQNKFSPECGHYVRLRGKLQKTSPSTRNFLPMPPRKNRTGGLAATVVLQWQGAANVPAPLTTNVVASSGRRGPRLQAKSTAARGRLSSSAGAVFGGLQRVQVADQVAERERFLLGLFGHPIDLFEGRDAADHLQHAVGVKC